MTKFTRNDVLGSYGIVPDSGFFGQEPQFSGLRNLPQNPSFISSGSFPSSFSNASFDTYVQQTFLGATILDFSISAGYGDTASQLSVSVINDEYNKSDNTPLGQGADIYHSGANGDRFNPPPIGSPVFFTFGKGGLVPAENIYQWQSSGLPYMNNWMSGMALSFTPPHESGRYHFAFGGILQGWTQNRNTNGFTFNVNVVDPRQILSSVKLILNNYAEGIYKTENIINVYGFLEHNPSEDLLNTLQTTYSESGILTKYFVEDEDGEYTGKFTYMGSPVSGLYDNYYIPDYHSSTYSGLPRNFPITGTGMSRRSPVGIPFYRIIDAVSAQMRLFGDLPEEYIDHGFETFIRFRGYNYIIDFGSLPTEYIPRLYYVDFEEVSMLDFMQEICEIVNHELFISLLPINDHPKYQYIKAWNAHCRNNPDINIKNKIVAGIIRIDAIDRTPAQEYGKIAEYIRDLDKVYRNDGTLIDCRATDLNEEDRQKCLAKQTVTSSDIGFELTDVTTEKFVAGANEVNMHFFTGNCDRDTYQSTEQRDLLQARQYTHDEMITQQILPYYGMLGFGENVAVTIPRGFGAYQQILLDTTALNVNGVGSYYVATEMELRCAMVSFERWKEFLLMYNDVYMESVEEDDAIEGIALLSTPQRGQVNHPTLSNNYAVTVPRCVFESDRNYLEDDGLPASPCAPPYGYPLYYKRALKIGIPEGGLTKVTANLTQSITDLAKMRQEAKETVANIEMKGKNFRYWSTWFNNVYDSFRAFKGTLHPRKATLVDTTQASFTRVFNFYDTLSSDIDNSNSTYREYTALIDDAMTNASKVISIMPRLARKQNENAKKVYNFIKNIAEECLGKKFLVKIPIYANSYYQDKVEYSDDENDRPYTITKGPFGFKPKLLNSGFEINGIRYNTFNPLTSLMSQCPPMKTYLTSGIYDSLPIIGMIKDGALKSNYQPITDTVEFNYMPSNEGGFFDFDLYDNVFKPNEMLYMMNNYPDKVPSGVRNLLVPQDLTPFISENGRVSAYVRFDWSNYLSLESFSSNDYTQQSISTSGLLDGMMPDISNSLDNVGEDFSFADTKGLESGVDITKWSCAFVKCDLSEKFYMPPKTKRRNVKLFATGVVDIGSIAPVRQLFNEETCEFETSFSYYLARYIPKQDDSGVDRTMTEFNKIYEPLFSGKLIDTRKQELDYNNVYALITLPGRPIPLKDIRFRDAMYFGQNPVKMKHILTQDTIKDPTDILGFKDPVFVKKPTNILRDYCSQFSAETLTKSFHIYKETMKGMTFGLPQRMHVAVPSPVYPDVVCISLESKDRCYGPWITTLMNSGDLTPELAQEYGLSQYRNIGGKLEYIRDENLAPWNYCGHDLMNEAGKLKASYGNSLMLHSERGGFVYADAPSGISIGRSLMESGAYVTSIDVSVSTAGIQTTVKLDSYTAQWGKLNRQKEIQISQISRERQKLRDTKNQFIRRGIGKGQTSINYGEMIGSIEKSLDDSANQVKYRVGSIQTEKQDRYRASTANPLSETKIHSHNFYVGNTNNFGITDEQGYHRDAQSAVVEPENRHDVIATRNPQATNGAVKTQIVNNEYRMSQYTVDSDLAAEQGWTTPVIS
jgi:hypothetical protein